MPAGHFFDFISGESRQPNLGSLGRGAERRAEAEAIAAGKPPTYHPFSVKPPSVDIYCVRKMMFDEDVNNPFDGGTFFSAWDGEHWNGAWYSISEAIEQSKWWEMYGDQEFIDRWLRDHNTKLYWRKTIKGDTP